MGSFKITFHITESNLPSYGLKRLKKLLGSYIDEINFRKGEMDPDDIIEMEELLAKFTNQESSSSEITFDRKTVQPIDETGKPIYQLVINLKDQKLPIPFAIITAVD